MSKMWANVKGFADETSIHGFHELMHLKNILGKILWVVVMAFVLIVCVFLLQDLASDIMNEPKVTSITESHDFEEPKMYVFPAAPVYKDVPLKALNEAKIYNLTMTYASMAPAPGEDEVQVYNFNFNTHRIRYYQFPSSAMLIEAVRFVQYTLQQDILGGELYQSNRLMTEDLRMRTRVKSMVFTYPNGPNQVQMYNKMVLDRLFIFVFHSHDRYVEELIELMDIMHIDDIEGDVNDFFREHSPVNVSTSIKIEVGDRRAVDKANHPQPESVISKFGLGYVVPLSIKPNMMEIRGARKQSSTAIYFSCDMMPGIYGIIWGIGTEFQYLDQYPKYRVNCGEAKEYDIVMRKKTYHKRYCKDDIKTSCLGDCLIRESRAKGLCLPYMGVPDLRRDVPFCTSESEYRLKGPNSTCFDECNDKKLWRPCKSFVIADYIDQPSGYPNPKSISVFINIDMAYGMEHIHLEPKYTVSNILGSVGGIVGIGFGVSIMSVMQILYYCCKMAEKRSMIRDAGEDEEKDNAKLEKDVAEKV